MLLPRGSSPQQVGPLSCDLRRATAARLRANYQVAVAAVRVIDPEKGQSMADKNSPSHRGMARDAGIKMKAAPTGFRPSTGGSAVAKAEAPSKPATQASADTTKTGDSSKG